MGRVLRWLARPLVLAVTALVLVFGSMNTASASDGTPSGWDVSAATRSARIGKMTLRWEPELNEDAYDLIELAPLWWSEVEADLAGDVDDEVEITFLSHAGRVAEASDMPRWVAGVAHSSTGEILIARHGPDGDQTNLEELLRHEMAHVVLYRALDGKPVPEAPLLKSPYSPRTLQYLLMLAGVGCCVAMSMPQVHIVSYCVDLGYGAAVGAEMLALMSAGGVASRLASGALADYIGGVRTLLLGSVLQCMALFFFLPFDGLMSLYAVSLLFGLSQGGIVPSYAIVVREYMPASEAGGRIGIIVASTILGMALGGWMSGEIYDLTGSYELAFINGIAWNVLNMAIILSILWRTREPSAPRAAMA